MVRAAVVALLLIGWGCSARKTSNPLAGSYVGWMFMDGQARPADGTSGVKEELILKPDGTYTFQLESSAMMLVNAKAEGTYTQAGGKVDLRGTITSTMDDGYKKGTETGLQRLTFEVENGMLTSTNGKGEPFYFRKRGTGPPPLPPQLQLKPSSSAAIALLQRVKRGYANLKTFRATGRVLSQGGGFVAKDARFTVLFKSPSEFRFEASIFDGATEFDRTEITWDGSPKCWWYSKEFGETRDRPLGNALSIAAVNCGPEADILPSLLLPKEIGDSGLLESPEATLLADEKIGGRECSVLQLKSQDADATRLWIEKSSGMILCLYEDLRAVTVTFDPQPNVTIDPKELMLGRRSKPVGKHEPKR